MQFYLQSIVMQLQGGLQLSSGSFVVEYYTNKVVTYTIWRQQRHEKHGCIAWRQPQLFKETEGKNHFPQQTVLVASRARCKGYLFLDT